MSFNRVQEAIDQAVKDLVSYYITDNLDEPRSECCTLLLKRVRRMEILRWLDALAARGLLRL
jgi:hypothetical protein